MNAFDIRKNFAPALAALGLAAAMSFVPAASAHADEVSTVEITYEAAAPQDAALLRRLLSNPQRNAEDQLLLERTMDGVYEELADASPSPAPAQSKDFIRSVNELLGIKTDTSQDHAQG